MEKKGCGAGPAQEKSEKSPREGVCENPHGSCQCCSTFLVFVKDSFVDTNIHHSKCRVFVLFLFPFSPLSLFPVIVWGILSAHESFFASSQSHFHGTKKREEREFARHRHFQQKNDRHALVDMAGKEKLAPPSPPAFASSDPDGCCITSSCFPPIKSGSDVLPLG